MGHLRCFMMFQNTKMAYACIRCISISLCPMQVGVELGHLTTRVLVAALCCRGVDCRIASQCSRLFGYNLFWPAGHIAAMKLKLDMLGRWYLLMEKFAKLRQQQFSTGLFEQYFPWALSKGHQHRISADKILKSTSYPYNRKQSRCQYLLLVQRSLFCWWSVFSVQDVAILNIF